MFVWMLMDSYLVKKQRVKKMKKIINFFACIFSISIIYAIISIALVFAITTGCGDEVDIDTACVIRTPPISCNTYSIYNTTGNLTNTNVVMEEVRGGSGVYNFTFVGNGTGVYSIVLCDNTSAQINVETTDETDLGTILSNQATLQNNIETVNQTVKDRTKLINDSIIANLSNDLGFFNPLLRIFNNSIILHIRNNVTAAVTDIVSRGDSAWITATGFQTESDAATRYGNLLINFSDVLNNATDILADTDDIQSNQNWDVWDDGTRTLTTADWQTESNAATRYENLLLNFSDVINNLSTISTRGNIAWITATGFQTESNALTRFTSLSDGIQNNATNVTDSITANITATAEDIKINITGTGFASNVWAFVGNIVDNILTQISNSTFRRSIQNATVVPLVNESTGIIVNETLSYVDGSEVVTTFIYNESTLMILNSSSSRND